MTHFVFDAQITFLPTADLKACAHFYETIILLPLTLDQGTCRIYQVAPGGYLGFCQHDHIAPPPDGWVILTLVCDDVDDWYARLKAQGVTLEQPPRENEQYRVYHFFAHDPDGYRLEFQRFLDPFPPATPHFPPDPGLPPPERTA